MFLCVFNFSRKSLFFGFLFLLIYLFRMSMYEQVMASTKNLGEALKIMISGSPASGKGTQCELITKKVLEAVGPVIFLSTDTRKLRNEGFLCPYHPRYPELSERQHKH